MRMLTGSIRSTNPHSIIMGELGRVHWTQAKSDLAWNAKNTAALLPGLPWEKLLRD